MARHPSETQDHVVLRLLAWCLLHEEGLAFGPGLSTPDAADLWTHDPTGRLTTWIECGTATARAAAQVAAASLGRAHATSSSTTSARSTALRAELAGSRWPRSCPPPTLWLIDRRARRALAAREERRQRGPSPSSAITSTSTSTGARSTARLRRIRPRREPEAADDVGLAGAGVGAHRPLKVAARVRGVDGAR